MATEDNADVEALNQGLNTPTDEDDNPPGYGESDEPEDAPEELEAEPSEEEEEAEPAPIKATQEEEEEDPKPLTRGQQRIQSLANEKKLAEDRAKLLELRLQQLETERQQQATQNRPQEEENLSDLEKWQRQADATIRQVQFQNLDMQDKSEFLTQVSKNPGEAAYIERVEQTLVQARQAGFNPKREDVLIRLMGLDARSKVKEAPAVKRDAAQRITAAKGKPLAAKSNVAATKTESTEFDRLKDIIL